MGNAVETLLPGLRRGAYDRNRISDRRNFEFSIRQKHEFSGPGNQAGQFRQGHILIQEAESPAGRQRQTTATGRNR